MSRQNEINKINSILAKCPSGDPHKPYLAEYLVNNGVGTKGRFNAFSTIKDAVGYIHEIPTSVKPIDYNVRRRGYGKDYNDKERVS